MIYRDFGKTGLKVSAIGVGCEYVWTADEQTVYDLVRTAVDAGVNYFDLFVGTPSTREYYGKALKGVRDKVHLAGHLGCADLDGQYVKTRDEALCKDFWSSSMKSWTPTASTCCSSTTAMTSPIWTTSSTAGCTPTPRS